MLGRPPQEKPFLILVVGYPGRETRVPDISKQSSEECLSFV
jgi:iodotyrosine deiodinase